MGAESGLRRRVEGLSEAAFRQRYGTGERAADHQCRAALLELGPRAAAPAETDQPRCG